MWQISYFCRYKVKILKLQILLLAIQGNNSCFAPLLFPGALETLACLAALDGDAKDSRAKEEAACRRFIDKLSTHRGDRDQAGRAGIEFLNAINAFGIFLKHINKASSDTVNLTTEEILRFIFTCVQFPQDLQATMLACVKPFLGLAVPITIPKRRDEQADDSTITPGVSPTSISGTPPLRRVLPIR
jgi:hypothetical protein